MSDTSTAEAPPSGAAKTILWTLSLLAGLFFLATAYNKFTAQAPTVAAFTLWGYGPGFMRGLAYAETIGGVALLVPRLTTWGAALLSLEMLGAIFTILTTGVGLLPVPIVCLAVLSLVGWQRRERALGLAAGS